MAYATGTAATVDALMSAVSAFAVASAGMTEVVNRSETISSASWTVRCLSKGSQFWWFRSRTNDLYGMPATSSAGATWATITGRPTNDSRQFPLIEPFTVYHLFTDGSVVHVAALSSNGAWYHFNFGELTKYGTWTGGHYVGMTYQNITASGTGITSAILPDAGPTSFTACGMTWYDQGSSSSATAANSAYSFMYAPYNANTTSLNFASAQQSNSIATTYNRLVWTAFMSIGTASTTHVPGRILQANRNHFNARSPGLRVECFMYNALANKYLPMGYVNNLRVVNMTNYTGGDTVNTDWMVFPFSIKGTTGIASQAAATGPYGWAVKK